MLLPDPELAVDYGLFSVAQALAAGISRAEIDRGVRRGRWDRPARGILRAADREARAGDELLMAVLRAGPGAVAGFESAAAVHGWDPLSKPPAKPQLIAPFRSYQPPDLNADVYRAELSAEEVTLAGVVPLATQARTALDIAASRPLEYSVVVIESALRSRGVTLDELHQVFSTSRRRGVPGARKALQLADSGSGSVPESQARMLFRRYRLPEPVTQFAVYDDGRFIARTDFAWPWARVVGELDGFAYHSSRQAFQRDRDRQNELVRAGWKVIRFTVADIYGRELYVVWQVQCALDRDGASANLGERQI